jgi:hypothetical protein
LHNHKHRCGLRFASSAIQAAVTLIQKPFWVGVTTKAVPTWAALPPPHTSTVKGLALDFVWMYLNLKERFSEEIVICLMQAKRIRPTACLY